MANALSNLPTNTLANPTLGPYSANNSALNVAFSAGLDIQAPVPADGRSVVWDDVQRKNLRYCFAGLEVRVLGTGRKWMFIRQGHPPGVVANNDAWWTDITEGVAVQSLKGLWDATTNFPGLLLADPKPADYYIVQVGGTNDIGPDVDIVFERGDLVVYEGPATGWKRIANYSPVLPVSFTHNDITDWTQQITYEIAHGAIKVYNDASPYKQGQVVAVVEDYSAPNPFGEYGYQPKPGPQGTQAPNNAQDANATNIAVTLYQAQRDVNPGEQLGNPSIWLMIATTNYNRLYGRLKMDNTAGTGGSNAANDDGEGKVMDIKETMRRVRNEVNNFAGGITIIDGGYPDTPDAVLGAPRP